MHEGAHNWSHETGLRSFQQSRTALGRQPTPSHLADQPKTCVLYLHWQGGRVPMKSTQQNSEEVELGRPQDYPASRLALWLPLPTHSTKGQSRARHGVKALEKSSIR